MATIFELVNVVTNEVIDADKLTTEAAAAENRKMSDEPFRWQQR